MSPCIGHLPVQLPDYIHPDGTRIRCVTTVSLRSSVISRSTSCHRCSCSMSGRKFPKTGRQVGQVRQSSEITREILRRGRAVWFTSGRTAGRRPLPHRSGGVPSPTHQNRRTRYLTNSNRCRHASARRNRFRHSATTVGHQDLRQAPAKHFLPLSRCQVAEQEDGRCRGSYVGSWSQPLASGKGILKSARECGVGSITVQRMKAAMAVKVL